MDEEGYLLHPNSVRAIPFGNSLTTRLMNQRIREALADDPATDPDVSVVVRTLNEAAKLQRLLADISQQNFASSLEVIIVDNESTDNTKEIAKHYGAKIVTLARNEFTYPKSMNLGMNAASHDAVFLTVGHARLSNIHTLHAGARHFGKKDSVAGAFGTILPDVGASSVERWSAVLDTNRGLARPATSIKTVGMGVLGCTGAMISKSAWNEVGRFDERYQTGGEDTALARLLLAAGMGIVREPALSVHHSHGLGLKDTVKQLIHQRQTLRTPKQFDREELLQRRPDLRANRSTSDPLP
jgi:N-acetylglucosaminyl-diphospho-decaprenol L-rhamnosyltransferase